jgi:D-serine dehydratase
MNDTNILQAIRQAKPVCWHNPARANKQTSEDDTVAKGAAGLGLADLALAQARFERFAPLLAELFDELAASAGAIRSKLQPIARMQKALGLSSEQGRMWVKADHSLPVAGSVKARGGFHEILELTERLALQHGLLASDGDLRRLRLPASRRVLRSYRVAVGSTGNLGLSIGVIAAALGYRAVVHMSAQAKSWKKQRLRACGVEVIEHPGDYEQAVAQGRQQAAADPHCHFVDDERSVSLLLGYACAAYELQAQLASQHVQVDAAHPLKVYLPCGVGGAPAGIAWGLQLLFGEHVRCYFAEPVQSPCFLLQMLAAQGDHPSVYELGLSNQTAADGLAVPRASLLAAELMRPCLAGTFTVQDATLYEHLALLHDHEGLRIEPSAAAGFGGPRIMANSGLNTPQTNHVIWSTGGALVPPEQFQGFLDQGRGLRNH